jgi:hypothetical protein
MVPAGQAFASRFTRARRTASLPALRSQQAGEVEAAPGALIADFAAALLVLGDHLYVDADQRLNVGDQCGIAGGDQDVAMLGDDAGHHLHNAWIGPSRMGVDLVQDRRLRGHRQVGGGDLDRGEVARRRPASSHRHRTRRGGALRDAAGGNGGQHRAPRADLVGVGVPLALSGQCADADALLQVAVGALDDALLEDHRVPSRVLEEEVCVIDLP